MFNIASRPAESSQGILGIPTPVAPKASLPVSPDIPSPVPEDAPESPTKLMVLAALVILCVAAWLGGGLVALLWMSAVVGVSGIAVLYISNMDGE